MRLSPGILLIVIGLIVFFFPHWVPLISDARGEPEAFRTAGQIGGGLIGVGLFTLILALVKNRSKR